jgi:uncharacterized phage-associated protein
MIQFTFNERKAAQAAAHLLRRHGGRMPYISLLKLLYLADREKLLRKGSVITGDRFVAMPKGPVLSIIYDLISGGSEDPSSPWFQYVSPPEAYSVALAAGAPDATDELSKFELGILDEIDRRWGGLDKWALVKLTHDLPEWVDPQGSSMPIDPADILRHLSVPDSEILRVAQDAEEDRFFARLAQRSADH